MCLSVKLRQHIMKHFSQQVFVAIFVVERMPGQFTYTFMQTSFMISCANIEKRQMSPFGISLEHFCYRNKTLPDNPSVCCTVRRL